MTLRNTLIEELGEKRYEELLNTLKDTPIISPPPKTISTEYEKGNLYHNDMIKN